MWGMWKEGTQGFLLEKPPKSNSWGTQAPVQSAWVHQNLLLWHRHVQTQEEEAQLILYSLKPIRRPMSFDESRSFRNYSYIFRAQGIRTGTKKRSMRAAVRQEQETKNQNIFPLYIVPWFLYIVPCRCTTRQCAQKCSPYACAIAAAPQLLSRRLFPHRGVNTACNQEVSDWWFSVVNKI